MIEFQNMQMEEDESDDAVNEGGSHTEESELMEGGGMDLVAKR